MCGRRDLDSTLNLIVKLLAPFNIFWREPDTQILIPHAGVKPPGEFLILSAVADEA